MQSIFTAIRKITVVIFIALVVLLTFVGVLSIWDVLDQDFLGKSIGSILVLGLSSLLIITAAMERENHPLLMGKKIKDRPMSLGRLIVWAILLSILFSSLGGLF